MGITVPNDCSKLAHCGPCREGKGRLIILCLIQVIRFDDGNEVSLRTKEEFLALLEQNTSKYATFTRNVRRSLRALEGQQVFWPYTHIDVSVLSNFADCLYLTKLH